MYTQLKKKRRKNHIRSTLSLKMIQVLNMIGERGVPRYIEEEEQDEFGLARASANYKS